MTSSAASGPAPAAAPPPACPTDTRAPLGKRPFIQRLFSQIAPRYDWFNRLVTCGLDQRWRRSALRRGEVGNAHTVLDLCAGTGDFALLCAQRQQGRGTVIGADFNAAMLVQAQAKQRRRGLQVGWVQGDAEALPFPAARFDRVVIGFSTRNLTDLDAGLREMVRVLKPGGQLVILETGSPAHAVLRGGYLLYLYTIARVIGLLLTGRLWPFTYLARSVKQFLTPAQMVEHLQRAETQVQYVPFANGLASLYLATKPADRGTA